MVFEPSIKNFEGFYFNIFDVDFSNVFDFLLVEDERVYLRFIVFYK